MDTPPSGRVETLVGNPVAAEHTGHSNGKLRQIGSSAKPGYSTLRLQPYFLGL